MLCFEYKLYTKILAEKIENILLKIIDDDQFGFVKGRYIGNCVKFIQDLIDHCDLRNIPGILLQLDFEMAFDTIE